MADQVQADPQKLLDTAVQFSNKANDDLHILTTLDSVARTNIQPSLADRALSSFEYLWAAWMNEFLGISKATEALGLALGNAAIGFLEADGQDPTKAEAKEIATLKQNFDGFKSTFDQDTKAVKKAEDAAKTTENSSGKDTAPKDQPKSNQDPPIVAPPSIQLDGHPAPGPDDKVIGELESGVKVYQDYKGNWYIKAGGGSPMVPETIEFVPPNTKVVKKQTTDTPVNPPTPSQ